MRQGSQGLCRSTAALKLLKKSFPAFLLPDVKGHETDVPSLYLGHFDAKSLEAAAVSTPEKMGKYGALEKK